MKILIPVVFCLFVSLGTYLLYRSKKEKTSTIEIMKKRGEK